MCIQKKCQANIKAMDLRPCYVYKLGEWNKKLSTISNLFIKLGNTWNLRTYLENTGFKYYLNIVLHMWLFYEAKGMIFCWAKKVKGLPIAMLIKAGKQALENVCSSVIWASKTEYKMLYVICYKRSCRVHSVYSAFLLLERNVIKGSVDFLHAMLGMAHFVSPRLPSLPELVVLVWR